MTDLAQLKQSRLYSEELGIDLSSRDDEKYFRWFLASLLFGGHINETIARHTYQAFCRHQLTTPRQILGAGWDFLVNPIMREGATCGMISASRTSYCATAKCSSTNTTAVCGGFTRWQATRQISKPGFSPSTVSDRSR